MKDDLLDLAAREMVDLSVVARHALAVFCGYDPARIRRRRTIRERPVRIVQAPAHTDVALLSSIASIDQELQVIVQESAVGRCSELVREVHEIIDDLHALMPGLESLIGLPHEQQ